MNRKQRVKAKSCHIEILNISSTSFRFAGRWVTTTKTSAAIYFVFLLINLLLDGLQIWPFDL